MTRKLNIRLAIVLAITLLISCFAYALPVNAASTPDMKKANVKWDLRNNKSLKFKTTWTALGTQKHTVKMTNLKIKNAKKKGYKQCTFTLTYWQKIAPTEEQIAEMAMVSDELDMLGVRSSGGNFGGGCYYTVVDYRTGKSLEGKNNQHVKVTSYGWKYSNYVKETTEDGIWIKYPTKSSVKVKITYPKKYKYLALGVGGYTAAPEYIVHEDPGATDGEGDPSDGSGIGAAGASAEVTSLDLSKFWNGKKAFSKETNLYSKTDKGFAHFMRIK